MLSSHFTSKNVNVIVLAWEYCSVYNATYQTHEKKKNTTKFIVSRFSKKKKKNSWFQKIHKPYGFKFQVSTQHNPPYYYCRHP